MTATSAEDHAVTDAEYHASVSDRAALPWHPRILQGGMGVAVSDWRLARAVATSGQMGIVSGTAIGLVVARRLQLGDEGGHVRRALAALPLPGVAERILSRYYVEGGKAEGRPFKAVPAFTPEPKRPLNELTVAGNFVEVHLAKEGHDGLVGLNLLHKVRLPTPSSLYGALLAGVDAVVMGAGIPRDIPHMLDLLAAHLPAEVPLDLPPAADGTRRALRFDPAELWGEASPPALRRPPFFAIVSSHTLAKALAREPVSRPDGFVVEAPIAGGHNAPPRGKGPLDERGQPVYGPRDEADLTKVAEVGLPFWVAGGYAQPTRLAEALEAGASGVQLGTAFAFCEDSGIETSLKRRLHEQIRRGEAEIVTDAVASPTGFPFKVATLEGTLSEQDVYEERGRICDLGFLTTPYEREDGSVGMRCPSEPVDDWVRKGGDLAETVGRKCLCNGLVATNGLAQSRPNGDVEPPVITSGDDLSLVAELLERHGVEGYRAHHVIEAILARTPALASSGAT